MLLDLRSDTVTKPCKKMLQAMFEAEVGDDVFNEDPTVNKLEKKVADLFNMEAALFCPSGTMTNQIAIKTHTQPGDELICDAHSHIYNYEGGGISFNSGVQAKLLNGEKGKITAEQIINSINGDFDWLCKTSLVSLENTVNKAGGTIYSLSEILPIYDVCKKNQLAIHLDGARLFNALIETKEKPYEWGNCFDSISICLSKGLGAPAGSLLIGSKSFIKKARRTRKVFGGGMRQAGYIAAAGIFALDNNISRLAEDHRRAKNLANELSSCSFVKNCIPAESNIVLFEIDNKIPAQAFAEQLKSLGVLVSVFGKHTIRLVTHLDFNDDHLEQFRKIIKGNLINMVS
jgi:threonine aldolase